ncbi:MAG: hypothetical protein PHP62_04055 [Candidatus Moranbacteria bacterium]|nr:hypothetical protein [Candidatus Moranbacteria bacterium]
MPEIKPSGNFELPHYDDKKPLEENKRVFFELDKHDRSKITERDFKDATGNLSENMDEEKIQEVRDKISETNQEASQKKESLNDGVDYADQIMVPIMKEVQKEMNKFNLAMSNIAAGTPGTGLWEVRQTQILSEEFLASIRPMINEKIETEVAAGTLSADEVKELLSILSVDDNFKFWYKLIWSLDKTEKKFAEIEKCSAAEILQRNRSIKRKIEVGMKKLFGNT